MRIFKHSSYDDLVRWLLCNAIDESVALGPQGMVVEDIKTRFDRLAQAFWSDLEILWGASAETHVWSDLIAELKETAYHVDRAPLVHWLLGQVKLYLHLTEPRPSNATEMKQQFYDLIDAAWDHWRGASES